MSVLRKLKKNDIGNGCRYNKKARAPVNMLKANLKNLGTREFKEYVGLWIGDLTPLHLCSVLDKYVQDFESSPKMISVTGWYTVTISNCTTLPNSSIILALKYAMMPLKVQVYDFKRSDDGAQGQFLVDNTLLANRLKRLNGKVSVLYSSQTIDIIVEAGLPPSFLTSAKFTSELLAAMKAALIARYDSKSQTLHLSRFHTAVELKDQFCALHAVPMLQRLLQMISQEFPELRVLQLRDNFLCTLRAFDEYANVPTVQILDVSANRIYDLMELKNLQNMNLQTLDLTGNPLAKCHLLQIRTVLPHLKHIYGCTNEQQSAEVQRMVRCPSAHHNQFSSLNSEGFAFCAGFAKFYFNIFDEINRRLELEIYYDAQAILSLSVPADLLQSLQCTNSCYRLYNRNHLHLHSAFARCGKLRFGSQAVIQTICQLPEMQTNIEGAQMNIHIYDNHLRVFTLSGVCRERINKSGWQWRSYSRQFVMRPVVLPRWVITNDMLTITLIDKPHGRSRQDFEEIQSTGPLLGSLNEQAHGKKSSIDDQLEDINNYMPRLVLEPKTSSIIAAQVMPPNFKDMPALVPQATINAKFNLEQEVDDTILCSDDELLLVINEDEILETDDL